MSTNYNQLAKQYQKANGQLWRTSIELYSLMKRIGDLADKKVMMSGAGKDGCPASSARLGHRKFLASTFPKK